MTSINCMHLFDSADLHRKPELYKFSEHIWSLRNDKSDDYDNDDDDDAHDDEGEGGEKEVEEEEEENEEK